ncbi:hypothetical protein ACYE2N_12185 [Flavobacterium sp. MAHUQ-51]|uniref:hypothetical protein n=1 Tax=Flavobacterium sp. GCM10022190 TaxID=3252639 RepID=UPI00360FE7CE
MKSNFLLAIFILISHFSYSQTHKLLRGKVMSERFLLQNVDVINKTKEINTKTNEKGEFILVADVNDSILFYDKDYQLKRIKLSFEDLETNNIIIAIDKKPEELKEVVIRKIDVDWKFDKKWEQMKRDEVAVYRQSKQLKNPAINDGTITNGMDFVKIGKMLFGDLLKGKKIKADNPEAFKEITIANFDENFFTETLQIKKTEIDRFLSFCNFDPKSKKIISENSNALELMDFLFEKNIEFKKANATE